MAIETGHYKNVASSNLLIKSVELIKEDYDPSKELITVASLKSYQSKGESFMESVRESKNHWSTIVDQRQLGFKNVRTFSTRIMGILSGTNLSAKTIETARSINNKIQGVKLIKPKEADIEEEEKNPDAKKHSVSRQSYDSMYENFSDLVSLLRMSPGYDPNKKEFKIENLEAYAEGLLAHTDNMDQATVSLTEARRLRNEFMYTPETGFVDVMLDAKDFIKGIYGAKSEKFLEINKIKFKNIR